MNGDEKIDAIHAMCLELRDGYGNLLDEQISQGKDIATLLERSANQDERIKQTEGDCRAAAKRSGASVGGVSGTIGGILAGFLAQLLGFGSGQ